MAMTEADARHFLGRVGFVPDQADVDWCVGREIDDVVDDVLATERGLAPRPDWLDADPDYLAANKSLDWWLNRMADTKWVNASFDTPNPLVEKLAMFWHSHFSSSWSTVQNAPIMWDQNQILRAGALGDFPQMCLDISVHGAMLTYLNNETNVAGNVQENFARELMELFTMGEGNYTEFDVFEMARAWTGHKTVGYVNGNPKDFTYVFDASKHDFGSKTLFGIERNWDGPETIAEICRGVRQQETAEFISTKLWRFFVNGNPPPAAISQLAAAFIAADMDIKELMRALLKHPDFWAPASRRALIKSPSQYVVDYFRCVGKRFENQNSTWYMKHMGQVLFQPPNVAGWGTNGYWLSTATMWGRARFADDQRWNVDDLGLLTDLGDADPVTGANLLFDTYRIHEPSAVTRAAVERWCEATTAWARTPMGTGLIMLSPEFQVN